MSLHRVLSVLVSFGLVLGCTADMSPWDAIISTYTSSNATLKKDNCSRVLDNVSMCLCDNLCHADPRCMGVAYSSSLSQCRISPHHPTLSNTELVPDQSWLLAHRRAPGMANEDCQRWADCYGVKGPASCFQGKCACAYGFQLRFDTCLPADGTDLADAQTFGEMSTGVPDPDSLLASVPQTPPAECEQKCLATPSCLILNTTTLPEGDCSLFARLKSYSGGAVSDSTSVRARKFPYSEGEPPTYFRVLDVAPPGRRFVLMLKPMTPSEAARTCRQFDSVLYPAERPREIQAVFSQLGITTARLNLNADRKGVFVGIDMLLNVDDSGTDTYVSSNGRVVTDIDWNTGEPDNRATDKCIYVNVAAGYRLHGTSCDGRKPSVCEYLGAAVPVVRWHNENQHLTADLGAVYDVKEVRYTGADDTCPGQMIVSVSVVPGEEKLCVMAAAALAAPPSRSRRLICGSPSYGRYVHLHHDSSVTIDGDPAVYGTWLYT